MREERGLTKESLVIIIVGVIAIIVIFLAILGVFAFPVVFRDLFTPNIEKETIVLDCENCKIPLDWQLEMEEMEVDKNLIDRISECRLFIDRVDQKILVCEYQQGE